MRIQGTSTEDQRPKLPGRKREHNMRRGIPPPRAPMGYAMLFAFAIGIWAIADASAEDRPKRRLLRFEEDWSEFQARDGFWDSVKRISLNESGSRWVGFGVELRSRLEVFKGFGFAAPAEGDDAFLLNHVLAYADLHIDESFRIFVEGIHANSTGRDLPGGNRPLDVDIADLMNAFADFNIDVAERVSLTLRAGRQGLAFGKQRLVSPLPWANTRRSWDGFSAILNANDWKVHGFWTQFVPTRKYEFNKADGDIRFFGAYATTRKRFDLYYFGSERDALSDNRHTVGARTWGGLLDRSLDYDLEGAWQFGDGPTGDISAFMVASQLGFTLAEAFGTPRVWLGFDYASGDDDPEAGTVKTFDQLYPLGHAYLGYADVVGRQNIIDFSQGVSVSPAEDWVLDLANHIFWRADDGDALYNAGGRVVRAGDEGEDKYVGIEIDAVVKRRFGTHLSGEVGYSHFFTGSFIEESGPDNDIDFFYVQALYVF